MKIKTIIILLISHIIVGSIGFALGIYTLPILIAPKSLTESEISTLSSQAKYFAEFKPELKDSDTFHWGEGSVSVGTEYITFVGELAPGPDYKLYLSPEFVETENIFNSLKAKMVLVGDVKTFKNFAVAVPTDININKYNTVVVWCEAFGEFITSARYR
jgi:hypothetical protein